MASKRRKRTAPPPRPGPRPHRPRRTTGPATRAQQQAAAVKRRQQARRRRIVIALLLLTAVAAVAAYVVSSRRADDSLRQALTAGTCDVDTESDRISGADGHVPSPSYTVDPPAGGEHLNSVARDGVVVAEREGMSTLVAATAWGQRLLCGEVEPQALVGNGPEDVQRGQAARSPVTR